MNTYTKIIALNMLCAIGSFLNGAQSVGGVVLSPRVSQYIQRGKELSQSFLNNLYAAEASISDTIARRGTSPAKYKTREGIVGNAEGTGQSINFLSKQPGDFPFNFDGLKSYHQSVHGVDSKVVSVSGPKNFDMIMIQKATREVADAGKNLVQQSTSNELTKALLGYKMFFKAYPKEIGVTAALGCAVAYWLYKKDKLKEIKAFIKRNRVKLAVLSTVAGVGLGHFLNTHFMRTSMMTFDNLRVIESVGERKGLTCLGW